MGRKMGFLIAIVLVGMVFGCQQVYKQVTSYLPLDTHVTLNGLSLDPQTQTVSLNITVENSAVVSSYKIVCTTQNMALSVPTDLASWSLASWVTPSAITAIAVGPLSDNTDYYIQVAAYDKSGNLGYYSNPLKIRYKALLPFVEKYGSRGTSAGQFSDPSAIATDANGLVWIADLSNDRVVRFNPSDFSGSFTVFGADVFHEPQGIAVDSEGLVWVTAKNNEDESRIFRFNPGDFTDTITSFSTGNLIEFGDIATGLGGWMWVSLGNKIARFKPSDFSGSFESFGEFGSNVGQFIVAAGIYVDKNGLIWVSDWIEGRVTRFDPSDFSGTVTAFPLPHVSSITFDSAGYLWGVDRYAWRVFRWDPTTSRDSLVYLGKDGTQNGEFRYPVGLAIAGTDLFVLDSGNHRVQKFDLTPGASGPVINATAP